MNNFHVSGIPLAAYEGVKELVVEAADSGEAVQKFLGVYGKDFSVCASPTSLPANQPAETEAAPVTAEAAPPTPDEKEFDLDGLVESLKGLGTDNLRQLFAKLNSALK
jgi:hypothetical protein